MTQEEFQQLAEQALEKIPERFRRVMRNAAIVVADSPTQEQLQQGRVRSSAILLGLYVGVPLREREGRQPLYPDRIFLFQKSIEQVAGSNPDAIFRQILLTMWHEIGHHYGLKENEVRRVEHRIITSIRA